MKVSETWLREWVDFPQTSRELAEKLTMAGLEVDGLYPVAGDFTSVVVARVVHTLPHPQADRLTLCHVDIGSENLVHVVCGARNVRPGLCVALALPGAELPGGLRIKKSKLRGEPSDGMLCSAGELGLEDDSEGILELPDDAPLGVDLRTYLQLDDHVLDIDLTPNRADCLSVLGIAREVAALNRQSSPVVSWDASKPETQTVMPVSVLAKDACPQYRARVIEGIDLSASTPLWMKERLRRSGLRLVHPVVDVLNYVMLELGQPMHAFDLNKIKGGLTVRYAQEGESLVLLDGQSVSLHATDLVVADEVQLLVMAGVMGGTSAAVQAETTNLMLESAHFDPLVMAAMARRYRLCTDSSQRFERGVDPMLPSCALERATTLLLSIVGGKAGPVLGHSGAMPTRPPVVFSPHKVQKITGLCLGEAEMQAMLEALGMVVERADNAWKVTVPTYRFDVTLDVDLVEEIVRLYGYDRITEQPMQGWLKATPLAPLDNLLRCLERFFCVRGYRETISYSFVDPQLQEALYPNVSTMTLLNPISPEMADMRVGLWSGLLASMVHNAHRQQTALKLVESGVVFERRDGLVHEKTVFSGLITGDSGTLNWSEKAHVFDFYDIKGDLQALFVHLNAPDVLFEKASHSALHPGKTARMVRQGQLVGWVGALHPRLLDALDLRTDVFLFELSMDALLSHAIPVYQKISKYPQMRRDFSLLVPVTVSASQIEHVVRTVVNPSWLHAFDVFDLYQGATIPEGKKSVAIAVTLQHHERTLNEVEINEVIDALLQTLAKELAVVLRSEGH